MKKLIFTLILTTLSLNAYAGTEARVLCFDRFEDEIWEMTGEHYDDKTCKAMMISGTVGMCFEGPASDVVDMMNDGVFEYSAYQKVVAGTAETISKDIITYHSYEGDFVPWTRDDVEIFRCPEFNKIKKETTKMADKLDSTTDYAVTRRYREEFGTPKWVKE